MLFEAWKWNLTLSCDKVDKSISVWLLGEIQIISTAVIGKQYYIFWHLHVTLLRYLLLLLLNQICRILFVARGLWCKFCDIFVKSFRAIWHKGQVTKGQRCRTPGLMLSSLWVSSPLLHDIEVFISHPILRISWQSTFRARALTKLTELKRFNSKTQCCHKFTQWKLLSRVLFLKIINTCYILWNENKLSWKPQLFSLIK